MASERRAIRHALLHARAQRDTLHAEKIAARSRVKEGEARVAMLRDEANIASLRVQQANDHIDYIREMLHQNGIPEMTSDDDEMERPPPRAGKGRYKSDRHHSEMLSPSGSSGDEGSHSDDLSVRRHPKQGDNSDIPAAGLSLTEDLLRRFDEEGCRR